MISKQNEGRAYVSGFDRDGDARDSGRREKFANPYWKKKTFAKYIRRCFGSEDRNREIVLQRVSCRDGCDEREEIKSAVPAGFVHTLLLQQNIR